MNVEEYKQVILDNALDRDGFAYYDPLDDDRWGKLEFVVQTRNSDVLERSNFAVISEDLTSRFHLDATVERYQHWLVGWIEVIRINVDNEDAVEAALEWRNKLEDYYIADDDHYSTLEIYEYDADYESWGAHETAAIVEDRGLEELNLERDEHRLICRDIFIDLMMECGGDLDLDTLGDALEQVNDNLYTERMERAWRLFELTQPPLPVEEN
jgi:hypothetical protein